MIQSNSKYIYKPQSNLKVCFDLFEVLIQNCVKIIIYDGFFGYNDNTLWKSLKCYERLSHHVFVLQKALNSSLVSESLPHPVLQQIKAYLFSPAISL